MITIIFLSIPFILLALKMRQAISESNVREHDDFQHYQVNGATNLMIPEGIISFLKLAGEEFYKLVLENADVIVFRDDLEVGGYAHIGKKPRVVEIKRRHNDQNVSEPYIELEDITMAETLVHEVSHHIAWEKWHDSSERYPEKMELKFMKALKYRLKDRSYHIEIPPKIGVGCSIVFHEHVDYYKEM